MPRSINWKKNKWLIVTGSIYLAALLLTHLCLLSHLYIVTLSVDTAKTILTAIMGVAGSIIGFLVIYLTFALEAMRHNYGKHAINYFNRNLLVWVLCYFFVLVILLALAAVVYSDKKGFFWLWSFNVCCVSFTVGIVAVIPFGRLLLKETDSAQGIGHLIDQLRLEDFRELPKQNTVISTMHWLFTEESNNPVDQLSNMLYHHISEGNNRLVMNILRALFRRIEKLAHDNQGQNIDKLIIRYLDMAAMSFEFSKTKNDDIVTRLVFTSLQSAGNLIAQYKLGPRLIEHEFGVLQNILKHYLEAGKEDMTIDSCWVYFHMVRTQVLQNLPPAQATWTTLQDGSREVINTTEARNNARKFEAIDKVLTYDFPRLVDRSFLSSNYYIVEYCVRMLGIFLDMLIMEGGIEQVPKNIIGRSLAYTTQKAVTRFNRLPTDATSDHFRLYLGTSNLIYALEENSDLSVSVMDNFLEIFDQLVEHELLNKYDLEEIARLTRLVIANHTKIMNATDVVFRLTGRQSQVKIALLQQLKSPGTTEKEEKQLKGLVTQVQQTLHSYIHFYTDRGINNPAIEAHLRSL